MIRKAAITLDAASLAYGHGTDNPLDEASWLVLHALGLSPVQAPDYGRPVGAGERRSVDLLIRRRIDERLPAAYLTGRMWFAGHEFLCDERALVPRSPLAEFIVHDFFGLMPPRDAPRILDLCTGGGCIAIACAHALPDSLVDASDLSADALALAGENVALHRLESRVRLFEGSLFDPVRGPYDLVISNPPYVDALDLAAMSGEFRHEPAMGLGAGADGLDLVRPMLDQAASKLAPGGLLVVEVGNSAAALEAAYPDLELTWLEFAAGGGGVFVVTREELEAAGLG